MLNIVGSFLILCLFLAGCTLNVNLEDIAAKSPIQQQVLISLDENTPTVIGSNVTAFPISGVCSKSDMTFSITSPPPVQVVTCSDKKWSAIINLEDEADGVVNVVTDVSVVGSFLPVSFQLTKDTTAPTVSGVSIESGSLVTNKSIFSYVVSGTDVAEVFLTEDSNCEIDGEWKKTGTGTVVPSVGEGSKTFYVKTKDSVGNISDCEYASAIDVDRTVPVVTGLTDDSSPRASKTWRWSCTDSNGPCTYRHLITAVTPIAPVGVYTTTASGTQAGTGVYHIGVQAKDAAGNESAVVFVQATLDASLPDLVIQNGAAYTTSSSVTLNLSNLGTFNEVDLSNSPACASPTTLSTAATLPWNLTAGEGLRKVYFQFRDTTNMVSTTCAEVQISVDSIAPTVALTTPVAAVFAAPNFTVTATFSEDVHLFDLTKITVTNGVASDINGPALFGRVYVFAVTPTSQGPVTVQVTGAQVSDSASNGNIASAVLSRTFDTVSPTVTLSSAVASSFNAATFSVDASFSESVTGFDLSDLNVVNGVASALVGSGASYSFTITPSAQGPVTVSLGTGHAYDAAGNANMAALSLTRTYDTTAPIITGLVNDTAWTKSKTWTWGCNESCTYRYVVDTSAATAPTGAFGATTTVTESSGTGTYYLHVEAKDSAGNVVVTHVSAKLDNTAPTSPSSILDGMALNSLTVSPAITFTGGSDANSGVSKHQARVLKSSDNSEVATWSDITSGSSIASLALATNTSYYVEVRTVDVAGNFSVAGVSDGWIADTTAPLLSTVTASATSSLLESPAISWAAASDGPGGSGINRYEVRIFASPSGTAMSNWVALSSGSKVNSLTLADGAQYYALMRTVDNAGNTSATTEASNNWTAVNYDPCTDVPTTGMTCSGGAIYVGKLVFGSSATTTGPGDHYMTTPGGCTDVPADANRYGQYPNTFWYYTLAPFTPVCAGGTDSIEKVWGPNAGFAAGIGFYTYGAADSVYGSAGTAAMAASPLTGGDSPYVAGRYCDRLVYGGYDDWHLPNHTEAALLVANKAAIGGMSGTYWTSTAYGSAQAWQISDAGTLGRSSVGYQYKVRCVRRYNISTDIEAPRSPTLANTMYVSLTESPVLSWVASPHGGASGIDSYEVRAFKSSDNSSVSSWVTLASGNSLSGLSLVDGETYYYKIRTKAVDGNYSAEATSIKSWKALAVDPCAGTPAAGTLCVEGTYAIGTYGGFNYQTTPGNCLGPAATASCSNATDTLTAAWGTSGTKTGIISLTDGVANTTSLATYGDAAAAKFCDGLVFGGYSDWFLPAQTEMTNVFYTNLTGAQRTAIGLRTTVGNYYWTSTEKNTSSGDTTNAMYFYPNSGTTGPIGKTTAIYVRCVRKY